MKAGQQVVYMFFLRNRLYLGQTNVTSFCMHFENIGHGLLREVMKASFWGLFKTNFCGHFCKLFLFTKFKFSKFREKVFLNYA